MTYLSVPKHAQDVKFPVLPNEKRYTPKPEPSMEIEARPCYICSGLVTCLKSAAPDAVIVCAKPECIHKHKASVAYRADIFRQFEVWAADLDWTATATNVARMKATLQAKGWNVTLSNLQTVFVELSQAKKILPAITPEFVKNAIKTWTSQQIGQAVIDNPDFAKALDAAEYKRPNVGPDPRLESSAAAATVSNRARAVAAAAIHEANVQAQLRRRQRGLA